MTYPRLGPSTRVRVSVVEDKRVHVRADLLATDEPMEVRIIDAGGRQRTIAITIATPGRDSKLAAGFLFAEGVIAGPGDIARIDYRRIQAFPAQQGTLGAIAHVTLS